MWVFIIAEIVFLILLGAARRALRHRRDLRPFLMPELSRRARLHRYWLLRGRNVIIPLWLERRFWRLVRAVRHPRAWLYYRRMWRARPAIGERALVHGSEVHIVVGYGGGDPDRLIFEDGSSASWMNCCEPLGLSPLLRMALSEGTIKV